MAQLGLYDQYSAFKETVIALGPTYDCDIASGFTRDAANFQDPFHTTRAGASSIASSIWSGGHEWCDIRQAQ
jgi:hypothetical protein